MGPATEFLPRAQLCTLDPDAVRELMESSRRTQAARLDRQFLLNRRRHENSQTAVCRGWWTATAAEAVVSPSGSSSSRRAGGGCCTKRARHGMAMSATPVDYRSLVRIPVSESWLTMLREVEGGSCAMPAVGGRGVGVGADEEQQPAAVDGGAASDADLVAEDEVVDRVCKDTDGAAMCALSGERFRLRWVAAADAWFLAEAAVVRDAATAARLRVPEGSVVKACLIGCRC